MLHWIATWGLGSWLALGFVGYTVVAFYRAFWRLWMRALASPEMRDSLARVFGEAIAWGPLGAVWVYAVARDLLWPRDVQDGPQ